MCSIGLSLRYRTPITIAWSTPGAALLITSLGGVSYGEAIGAYCGEPLYHASLDRSDYEQLLAANGFTVMAHVAEDAECGGHS